jgi:alkanesulfonate monooxygenase SsuD/methylene tetrahydromethanopterin reductase-like flavin-dependent oxidoreductase (luciferase family)
MARLDSQGRSAIADFLAAAVIGSPDTVRAGFEDLLAQTHADEMMLVCDIHDPTLRLRALDIAAQVRLSEEE